MKMIHEILKPNVKNILNSLNDGIIITDENSIVEYINPAYKLFSGLKEDEIIGHPLVDVRPGAVLPKVLETLIPVVNVPRSVGEVQSYCDFMPLFNNEMLIGGLVVVKDVVRIKGLLKQLEENNVKISQMDEKIRRAFQAKFNFSDLIGSCSGLKTTIEMGYKASRTDSAVLLLGESGTGKEVMAQSIHNQSGRSDYPFVDINCAALPEHLLESELFGYVEGAFTGAKKMGKLGLFEIANGGTLFLDEISEMPLNLQTKLLRALQEQKIRKIGDETTIQLNVRIIAATNKDIVKMVRNKEFRDDLYFRLAVFVINIPPLRERSSDIPLFVMKFIEAQQRKKKKMAIVDEQVMNILRHYSWPGNVRELNNALEFAFNVSDDSLIDAGDLPPQIIYEGLLNNVLEKSKEKSRLDNIVAEVEKNVIGEYLLRYGDSVEDKKRVSEELGISVATLYNKIKKYKLS